MITDKEWEEYLSYCKARWGHVQGDRWGINTFLNWRELKIQNIDWRWNFKK